MLLALICLLFLSTEKGNHLRMLPKAATRQKGAKEQIEKLQF
jgi:hypothetical protein